MAVTPTRRGSSTSLSLQQDPSLPASSAAASASAAHTASASAAHSAPAPALPAAHDALPAHMAAAVTAASSTSSSAAFAVAVAAALSSSPLDKSLLLDPPAAASTATAPSYKLDLLSSTASSSDHADALPPAAVVPESASLSAKNGGTATTPLSSRRSPLTLHAPAPISTGASAAPTAAAAATSTSNGDILSAASPSAPSDRRLTTRAYSAIDYESANARAHAARDRGRSPTASELELRRSRDLLDGGSRPASALSPNMRRNTVGDGMHLTNSITNTPTFATPTSPATASAAAGDISPTARRPGSHDFLANHRRSVRQRSEREVLVGTPVKEGHVNFMLMYDMLTGIRISVSRCNAKPLRELVAEDYTAAHKLAFDATGNEMTPSSKYDFKFKDYAPWVFRRVREAFHVDPAEYLLSLTGKYVLSELGSPGKSGSFFYYSQDYRFIIKTIHHSEHQFILRILQHYYEHIRSNPHTLISRIFGLHRVKLPGNRKIHFVVMGNVFPPNKDIHETYDLKGSIVGRSIPDEEARKNPRAVMKDLNWLDRGRKILLGPEKRKLLIEQLERDATFLMAHNIMDYSLLVGIHDSVRGNKSNIRDTTLSVFEPNYETLSRRATAVTRGTKAQIIKKANAAAETDMLGPSTSRLPDMSPPERRYCIFYQDEGGFGASDERNLPLKEIYYLGVIDIFTYYSASKKVETFFKSIGNDRTKISAVRPSLYGRRFLDFMKNSIRGFSDDNTSAAQSPLLGQLPSSSDTPEHGQMAGLSESPKPSPGLAPLQHMPSFSSATRSASGSPSTQLPEQSLTQPQGHTA
ncbi:hypothetical protein BC831DRAFT_455183 [Entophlyctis helioformis]|nr:hypothetical protein BC831DRAFT_455183 [Entophlyctis helioformis]